MKFALFDWDLLGLAIVAVIILLALGEVLPAVVILLLMIAAVVIDRDHPRSGHVL
ncbi:hypothetical protein [Lacticaseibacillus nasuensis]|uniref:Uncharacterized protein n=1 Tax=Lacticaseibacillus nasuensis JCM 17158 TaxID=1291734 RepID=A0A0R1JRT4_9LACO|nr:hypothetical protein [Lacticaseibacillus nasuensis]KRK73999.1 hypothetical protein FD02_GL001833 [Lacticaseibacillus nasuensis JCM 17158]MCX2455880.1 hypothetical protein [Lacticaseibacillus nasuensis]